MIRSPLSTPDPTSSYQFLVHFQFERNIQWKAKVPLLASSTRTGYCQKKNLLLWGASPERTALTRKEVAGPQE